jgi:hypothetical protein
MMASGKNKSPSNLPWRPDFRDVASLPDLKIVRTHFLFNLIAVVLALVLVGLVVYQEYDISVRGDTLAEIRSSIRNGDAADKQLVQRSVLFMKDANRVLEAMKLLDVPVQVDDLVAELAKVQLREGRFTGIDYSRNVEGKDANARTVYRILVRGTMQPDATRSAPQIIDSFVSTIRNIQVLKDAGAVVDLVSSVRDMEMDYYKYEIRIEWGGAAK